jgi:NO-binding membrane sensor protein with MHYT domain
MVSGAVMIGGVLVGAGCWSFARNSVRVPVIPALLFTLGVGAIHFGAMSAITIMPDPSRLRRSARRAWPRSWSR